MWGVVLGPIRRPLHFGFGARGRAHPNASARAHNYASAVLDPDGGVQGRSNTGILFFSPQTLPVYGLIGFYICIVGNTVLVDLYSSDEVQSRNIQTCTLTIRLTRFRVASRGLTRFRVTSHGHLCIGRGG